jgi:hypothetical protein
MRGGLRRLPESRRIPRSDLRVSPDAAAPASCDDLRVPLIIVAAELGAVDRMSFVGGGPVPSYPQRITLPAPLALFVRGYLLVLAFKRA